MKAPTGRSRRAGTARAAISKFTLAELKRDFEQVEITAVCQCSGNRRGLFEPHVAGVEWGVGAMGNAVWRGVRLKDVLAKAGVKPGAVEVVFDGADQAPLDKTPDFVKSLPVEVARDENTLIAFEMNGEPLPHWNGFPARLVVPGWTGTYWVKHLTSVKVVSKPETNFWMSAAYRLPRGKFKTPTFKSQVPAPNEPITTMVVNSLITSLRSGQQIRAGQTCRSQGHRLGRRLRHRRGRSVDRSGRDLAARSLAATSAAFVPRIRAEPCRRGASGVRWWRWRAPRTAREKPRPSSCLPIRPAITTT